MQQRMKKDKWEKIVVFENREFRIRFWYDHCDLFNTSIEEKIKIKPNFFNRKGYYFEPIQSDYWIDETTQDPIEIALNKIKKCLKTEKSLKSLEEMLDNFCSM